MASVAEVDVSHLITVTDMMTSVRTIEPTSVL